MVVHVEQLDKPYIKTIFYKNSSAILLVLFVVSETNQYSGCSVRLSELGVSPAGRFFSDGPLPNLQYLLAERNHGQSLINL